MYEKAVPFGAAFSIGHPPFAPVRTCSGADAGKGGQGWIRLCGGRRMAALSPRPQRPSVHLWQKRPQSARLAQAASTPSRPTQCRDRLYKRGVWMAAGRLKSETCDPLTSPVIADRPWQRGDLPIQATYGPLLGPSASWAAQQVKSSSTPADRALLTAGPMDIRPGILDRNGSES